MTELKCICYVSSTARPLPGEALHVLLVDTREFNKSV
jgi:hypothetical protein